MESTLAGHVAQRVGGGPVDVTAVAQLAPAPLRRRQHARPHGVRHHGAQFAPATAVFHNHRVAVGHAAHRRVRGMDLHKRVALARQQAGLVRQAAGDEMVRRAADQVQRLGGRETAVQRLPFLRPVIVRVRVAGQRVQPLVG
ncbi:hypothetical protein RZS08_06570, partial [Arthrospira platensis SPKY1]|nr:hypothetical protein [Arthrospira platensis SPKY1]